MKNVKPIVLSRDKARKEWKEYVELCKEHNEPYLKDLKGLYYHLKQERKVIDIFEAFKLAGVNDKLEPKLAICKANSKTCYFEKGRNGNGTFKYYQRWNGGRRKEDYSFQVTFPDKTFPDFPLEKNSTWKLEEPKELKTVVPIVPPRAMPDKIQLKDCYILWEVDKWEEVPKDPILLKRITRNLFVVLSTWGLTKLERAVIRGRL
jgi:hypothetical protein